MLCCRKEGKQRQMYKHGKGYRCMPGPIVEGVKTIKRTLREPEKGISSSRFWEVEFRTGSVAGRFPDGGDRAQKKAALLGRPS